MLKNFFVISIVLTALVFSSCSISPNVMLKTDKDFKFDSIPDEAVLEYRISANDRIEFRLFANDGFKLIDLTSLGDGNNRNMLNRNNIEYLVEHDGKVKLPILGRVPLEGLTIREAEQKLEDLYSEFYNSPFVMIRVVNRRVIVFPGEGGAAKVITLNNNNTTLIEAIAQAGGIMRTGKAKKIKLIRGDLDNPQIYHINLREMKGISDANIIMQANDIVYIEPAPEYTREVIGEIAPVVSLVSSALTLYFIISKL